MKSNSFAESSSTITFDDRMDIQAGISFSVALVLNSILLRHDQLLSRLPSRNKSEYVFVCHSASCTLLVFHCGAMHSVLKKFTVPS